MHKTKFWCPEVSILVQEADSASCAFRQRREEHQVGHHRRVVGREDLFGQVSPPGRGMAAPRA